MKTFNKKDVLCIANAEDAIQYIGQECYFEDSFKGLQYCIDNNIKGLLKCVRDDDDDTVDSVFRTTNEIECLFGGVTEYFGMCLPCKKVYGKEDEYRPFRNEEEFKSVVGDIGSVIRFKPINCNAKYGVMFLGVLEDEFGRINVLIGGIVHDFAELFDEYVLLKDGKEVPFGIKVDHEES